MSYNEERLEHRQLFDYTKLGQEMAVNIAISFADTKHNQFCNDSDWTQISDNLTKNMTELVDLEQHINNSIKASDKTLVKIRQLVNESENSEEDNSKTVINIDEIFDEKMAEIVANDSNKAEEHENYKKLSEVLREFGTESEETDDELMALDTESEQIPIDPFSKKEIEFPVKNKTCGHIYDREQLRLVLEGRPSGRLRCPNMGCNNKAVTLNDVVDDQKTIALINKLKRNQRN